MTSHTACAILLGLAFVGCGKGDGASPKPDKAPDKSGERPPAAAANGGATAPGACLPGTWSMVESGVTRSFTFRADGSGEEVYSPQDLRPLRWTVKDAHTVHLTYLPHDDTMQSEAELRFDCAAPSFGPAGLYKKQ